MPDLSGGGQRGRRWKEATEVTGLTGPEKEGLLPFSRLLVTRHTIDL